MVCDCPAFASFQAGIEHFCWTYGELLGLIIVEETVIVLYTLYVWSYNADNLNMIRTMVK